MCRCSIPRLAVALCAQAALLGAASAQQADRPAVKPGDRWTFAVYYALPSATPNRTWLVTAVTPDAIEATENGQALRLSRDLNVIESASRRESNTLALQFPLRVGSRWRYETDTLFKDNNSTARTLAEVKVTAYETVRVPAGDMAAFRLEAAGTFTGLSRGGPGVLSGSFKSTYWYAPAARAVVRSEMWSTYRGAVTVELVASRLQD